MKRLIERWLFWDDMEKMSLKLWNATYNLPQEKRYESLYLFCCRRKLMVQGLISIMIYD